MKVSFVYLMVLSVITSCLWSSHANYRYPLGYAYNRLFFLAQRDGKSSICSIDHHALFNDNNGIQELSPLYNPYYVGMLANKKGFYFVDADILHIYYLYEREPRALELDEPLDHLGVVHWLNDYICYFSAQQKGNVGVWLVNTITGATQKVYSGQSNVYNSLLLPSIVCDENGNQQLFVFVQSVEKNSNDMVYNQQLINLPVVCESTLTKEILFDLEEILSQTFEKKRPQIQTKAKVLDEINSYKPLIDFSMHSVDRGHFVLLEGYKNDVVRFSVYQRGKKEGCSWETEQLCSFSLPRCYVLGGSQEIDHFSTLLPRVIDDQLYFLDTDDFGQMKLHVCDLETLKIKSVKTAALFIADCLPHKIDDQLVHGGLIS